MVIHSHKSKGKRNAALRLIFLIVICFCLNYQIKKRIPDITLLSEKDDNILDTLKVAAPYDPNRLCTQNQYAKSLNISLSEYAVSMDKWMDNKVEIERIQTKL